MCTAAKDLEEVDGQQRLRELLDQSSQRLESLLSWIDQLPGEAGVPALAKLRPSIRRAVGEIVREHARIDLDLLLEATGGWAHPVQALMRPRAPYETVLEACTRRLEEEESKGQQSDALRRAHGRLKIACAVEGEARRRREAAIAGAQLGEGDPEVE